MMNIKHTRCECGSKCYYSNNFDCYFCHKCDKWQELKCTDKECYYCVNRPEKPSEVIDFHLP